MNKKWYVYILICNDKSFYTGITNDLRKRQLAHNNGTGSAYTRSRKPVKIIYQETYANRSEALKREIEIKNLTRKKKENLIQYNKLAQK